MCSAFVSLPLFGKAVGVGGGGGGARGGAITARSRHGRVGAGGAGATAAGGNVGGPVRCPVNKSSQPWSK